jgi:hypothetical protein
MTEVPKSIPSQAKRPPVFIHPGIVAQFVGDSAPRVLADFVFVGADGFNVFPTKHDVKGGVGRSNTFMLFLVSKG